MVKKKEKKRQAKQTTDVNETLSQHVYKKYEEKEGKTRTYKRNHARSNDEKPKGNLFVKESILY